MERVGFPPRLHQACLAPPLSRLEVAFSEVVTKHVADRDGKLVHHLLSGVIVDAGNRGIEAIGIKPILKPPVSGHGHVRVCAGVEAAHSPDILHQSAGVRLGLPQSTAGVAVGRKLLCNLFVGRDFLHNVINERHSWLGWLVVGASPLLF